MRNKLILSLAYCRFVQVLMELAIRAHQLIKRERKISPARVGQDPYPGVTEGVGLQAPGNVSLAG
ncbi:hypothetical protein D3C86_2137490 [compost metagenome]